MQDKKKLTNGPRAAQAVLDAVIPGVKPWATAGMAACLLNMSQAVHDLDGILFNGDEEDAYPNRAQDFVRDVERWCIHMRSHLQAAQGVIDVDNARKAEAAE